jgi:hypothetical protein
MKAYRYSLDGSSKKHLCPECRRKRFVFYIDNGTGEPLHSTVGKCDRDDNCGYHYPPRQYFADNHVSTDSVPRIQTPAPKPKPKPEPEPSCIDRELLKKSLTGYDGNRFISYFRDKVGDDAARTATERYFIGTSEHWDGSTVFWQINGNGCICGGKIMQYDRNTGKRIKDKITWVHKFFNLPDFNLSQCLYGEHLLSDRYKTVAVVESEKTAIIASVYFPDMIWLSCGGKHGLNIDKCRCLSGRSVILFPDAKGFEEWGKKAVELSAICTVSVSSLIEERATEKEREAGLDLADYLVRYSPSEFIRRPLQQKLSANEAEICALNTEVDTVSDNPVFVAMCAKSKALSRLVETFDCEVTRTETYEEHLNRILAGDGLKKLVKGLPDNASWSERELCEMLKIMPQHVRKLADNKEIYFIGISGRYCRSGCTPF